MSDRLINDVAWQATLELVKCIRWERSEDKLEAFKVFFPIVEAAIERWKELKIREWKRLAKSSENPLEN